MLSFARYMDAISDEASRFLEVAAVAQPFAIPTCPGWTSIDLEHHLASCFRYWSLQVVAGDPESEVHETIALHSEAIDSGFELALDRLLGDLTSAGETASCWNWSDTDFDVLWVARHMAITTAIHRVDVELARSLPASIDSELAIDGLDETFSVQFRNLLPKSVLSTMVGSLCLISSDVDAAWSISVERGKIRLRNKRGPASVALVGSASDLLQFVRNRVDLDQFSVTGDVAVAKSWQTLSDTLPR